MLIEREILGTMAAYLDLLSKCFVVYRLGPYARNLRKEIGKAGKWYFYDTGVRNALIGAFSPLALRQDAGFLWENYLIGERIKRKNHRGIGAAFEVLRRDNYGGWLG